MWANFRVLAALEIGESASAIVSACQSARRTFAALSEQFASLAPDVETPAEPAAAQRIAPALLRAFGGRAATPRQPAPPDQTHVDLPVDDEPGEGDTVFDLPLEEPADGNAETQPLPL